MNLAQEKLSVTADEIFQIIAQILQHEDENGNRLRGICEVYRESAKNLLHYRTFRSFDIRSVQKKLKLLGLTRLANAEGNILGSLLNAHKLISVLAGQPQELISHNHLEIGQGKKRLKKHTELLFGKSRKNRRVRIMVTQPTAAAHDYQMVLDMVKNGMDCARINCAHDSPEIWNKIVRHVKKAAKECGVGVKIAMDLAGPKIRTGSLGLGPKVKKFRPERNALGAVEHPARIVLVPEGGENLEADAVPLKKNWLKNLHEGDKLTLKDTRGKKRKLVVAEVENDQVVLHCRKTVYLETGTQLKPKKSALGNGIVGQLPVVDKAIKLFVGDKLRVTKEKEGKPAQFGEKGNLTQVASIPCLPSQIIFKVKPNAPILFDDGKIEGIVSEVHKDYFTVKIRKAKENGSSLKAEKGINFPTLDMGLSGLTPKDKKDLEFVAEHADIVNYSFVNREEDVTELLRVLEGLGAKEKVDLVLKIETRFAYRNLARILLAAMQTKHIGVMIARGDLALEVGWENMGKVQDEILSLCGAAHVPVIWATQVLEGLAKKGLPSRSEITDITSSIRAECVMLNKGVYINETILLLDGVLGSMERLHSKKEGMWPKMEWI